MTDPQHPFERPRPPAGASSPNPLSDQSESAPDPRESAEITVNGEVVGYGMLGMGAALRKLLAPDEDEPAFDEDHNA